MSGYNLPDDVTQGMIDRSCQSDRCHLCKVEISLDGSCDCSPRDEGEDIDLELLACWAERSELFRPPDEPFEIGHIVEGGIE